MKSDECPICRSAKGQRITKKVALGQTTVADVARQFGLTHEEVEEHIYQHSPDGWTVADSVSKSYDRDYYVKRLESLHDDLAVWADEILEGDPTPENIRLATTLVKELRDTLRLLGEVTKILKDDEAQQALAAVKEMQMRYLALTNIIVVSACPECKERILKAVEEQRALIKS